MTNPISIRLYDAEAGQPTLLRLSERGAVIACGASTGYLLGSLHARFGAQRVTYKTQPPGIKELGLSLAVVE